VNSVQHCRNDCSDATFSAIYSAVFFLKNLKGVVLTAVCLIYC